MRCERRDRFDEIAPLLDRVEKPTRYLNHEWGSDVDLERPFHVCLVYPDTYEVGLPNMGLAILRNALNGVEGVSCERAYLPWHDMADLMRERGVPMLALESAAPVASFDVVGFTIAHEMACTNIVESLDLASVPVRASERADDDPVVLGGGPSVWNCEPVAPMFDAVCLGDGERLIVEACVCVRDARAEGVGRDELLRRLARISGMYVPSLYNVIVDDESTEWGYAVPIADGVPEVVT